MIHHQNHHHRQYVCFLLLPFERLGNWAIFRIFEQNSLTIKTNYGWKEVCLLKNDLERESLWLAREKESDGSQAPPMHTRASAHKLVKASSNL